MTVFEQVRLTLAKQLEIDPNSITESTKIVEDLGADSLDIIELLMTLEEKYNIIIDNNEISELTDVGKVAAYIESKLN